MQDLILTCTERWEGAAVGQEWPSLFCGTGLGRNGYSTVKMPLQQKIYNYETECTGKKGMIDADRKSVNTISQAASSQPRILSAQSGRRSFRRPVANSASSPYDLIIGRNSSTS
jgi:hypothetical protein